LQILGGPVVRLCNLVLLASSAFGHRVTWRGIRYQVNGRDHVRVVSRRAQTWWRKTFDHLELQRADRIAQTLQRHLQAGDAVLDYGCGSQIVGETIQRRLGVHVTGLDTLDFRKRDLPFALYDGFRAPFADRSFDVVLLSFVLHHCADGGLTVLKEAQRLARNKILLLEDSYENRAERLSIRLVDRVLNWLEDPRIEVPYRFRSIEQWKRLFAELGLDLASVESMRTTPLLHTRQRLFVLAPTSPETAPN
jgi:SAM-dependent methyltransferase